MVKLYTADKKIGTFIDRVPTVEEGLRLIDLYEKEDREWDQYEENFYDVVDENHCSVLN